MQTVAADVTVESADVPVGGAAVTVTVTVTPRVASDSVGVWMSSFWPGTVADVEFPAVTDEQVWGSQHDTGFVSWTIGGAHLGHAYVLRVHVSAADAGVPYSFRPWVEVGSPSWSAAPDVTGTEYAIDVPDLGPGP